VNYRPSSGFDPVIGACSSLLVGASMCYLAVKLIEAVWVWLAIITPLGLALWAAWALHRRRSSGW
jgi:small basic protein